MAGLAPKVVAEEAGRLRSLLEAGLQRIVGQSKLINNDFESPVLADSERELERVVSRWQ